MPSKKLLILAALGVAVPVFGSSPAQAVPSFGASSLVSTREASEPGVDIGLDGTIYVNAPGGVLYNSTGPGPSFVWKSTDGGATFTETSNLTRLAGPGGGDSDIVVRPGSGDLAMTDLWLGSSSVASDLGSSADTWATNPVQGVVAQDRQWLAATDTAVYHVTHQLEGGLIVSKSLDGGITYPVHALAATPVQQGYCLCFPGNMIAESGGPLAGTISDKVGVIFPSYNNNPANAALVGATQGVSFARSFNGGATWDVYPVVLPSSANRQGVFPVVANMGGNNLAAVWYENGKVAFAKSANWGANWSGVTYLSGSDSTVMPWVDAQGSKIAISYYGKTGGKWYIRYVESIDGGTTFSAPVSADATAVKNANPCLDGLGCGGDRELGDFQQVVIDPAGKSNIVYVRSHETSYYVPAAVVAGFLYTDVDIRYVKQS